MTRNRPIHSRTIPTRVGRTRWHRMRTSSVSGPSPRGWGERWRGQLLVQHLRTIPTRVGRTRITVGAADHLGGPSPRGWGEQRGGPRPGEHRRTIPTRVGRTLGTPASPASVRTIPTRVGRTAHACRWPFPRGGPSPRGWGERQGPGCVASGLGPSPRGWGEPPPDEPPDPEVRTIPTRVGRTK